MGVARPDKRFAARLRRDQTDAERRIWLALRNRRLAGAKFRRQVPIGPYVADFVCLDSKLIVELDGGQHGGPQDAVRQQWLEERAFQVLRFWNNEVTTNFEGVLTTIAAHLAPPNSLPPDHPHPGPLPPAGEGEG